LSQAALRRFLERNLSLPASFFERHILKRVTAKKVGQNAKKQKNNSSEQ
jgi:hypothetical protein